jgi:hypothetical protein
MTNDTKFASQLGGILGRLLAVMVLKGIISERDKDYICGDISENQWLGVDSDE